MSLPNEPNLYKSLHVIPNSDGTFTRPSELFPTVPPSTTDPASPTLSKDAPINSANNTWVRIFLPRKSLAEGAPPKKLLVLIYIHGGGFVVESPASTTYHDFCSVAASKLDVLVVSVSYRLAPEHRLPAAYHDVLEALTWLKHGQHQWVRDYGDLSSCVLMGDSAGGNITYHVGLNVADNVDDFKPLVIRGFVLIQPFIGSLERSGSEIRVSNVNRDVSLELLDLLWELSLPFGADRTHEYCDVIKNGRSGLVDRVRELGWWVAVVSCDGDPLYDRHVELGKLLEDKGVNVRTMLPKGGRHGMFVGGDPRTEFLHFVKEFWP